MPGWNPCPNSDLKLFCIICRAQRAEWKWAVERAAVASRWTWLQAQVSDLEYRIRQQNDIYRQIRASKGAVILEDQVPIEDLIAKCKAQQLSGKKLSPLEEKLLTLDRKNMSPSDVQQLLNNVARQSTQLAQQVGNFYSPESAAGNENSKTPSMPNGFVDGATSHAVSSSASTPDSTNAKRQRLDADVTEATDPQSPQLLDASCQAARCRPVRSYRKRKLLRTSGLHQMSRKASRLSTVRCHCYPPVVACAMCGGRYNNVTHLEPDVMPLPERVALLDPSFHPVLSFTRGERGLEFVYFEMFDAFLYQEKKMKIRIKYVVCLHFVIRTAINFDRSLK